MLQSTPETEKVTTEEPPANTGGGTRGIDGDNVKRWHRHVLMFMRRNHDMHRVGVKSVNTLSWANGTCGRAAGDTVEKRKQTAGPLAKIKRAHSLKKQCPPFLPLCRPDVDGARCAFLNTLHELSAELG
jgi:hypothetical protein